MSESSNISRLDLLEHVALPMGNLSRILDALLSGDTNLDKAEVRDGLRTAQVNAAAIYRFVLSNGEKPTSRVGMRTPEVLREFVALQCASSRY